MIFQPFPGGGSGVNVYVGVTESVANNTVKISLPHQAAFVIATKGSDYTTFVGPGDSTNIITGANSISLSEDGLEFSITTNSKSTIRYMAVW